MTDVGLDIFEPPSEPDHRPVVRKPPAEKKYRVVPCKFADTDAHTLRPAPHPGPRCESCHRVKMLNDKIRAAERQLLRRYGITKKEYDALFAAQGGKCYVCLRATGKRKKLAVEHDHTLALQHGHPIDEGCALCITGLACGPCNQDVLGRLGHQPAVYRRLADVLEDPPARHILREMREQ